MTYSSPPISSPRRASRLHNRAPLPRQPQLAHEFTNPRTLLDSSDPYDHLGSSEIIPLTASGDSESKRRLTRDLVLEVASARHPDH
ncbi:hypothetical protein PtA15_7A656 [Puccinia triticina]|uniref:Uncharacterized protein n=1 Tax=Puccinia triticina TaxID=208348 RepID=A0ABY7CSH6_9BASI|nr:uncharacterized protein PtA15_7A656 [Puccinia triticina]WAQ86927.1 hypothetical protein PtA15_7A656 [Puccinia triticina]